MTVSLVKYLRLFLKRTREELKQLDQKTRKYPRDDVDRLYVSRKEERRRLTSIKDSVDTTTQRLHRKAWRKTDHSYQKQYWQHEEQ